MDLSNGSYDLEVAAGKGIDVVLVHPTTGEILVDGEQKSLVITVLGRDSSEWQKASKQVGIKLAARYKKKVPQEAVEASLREVLSHCTTKWSDNIEWEDEQLPCTQENALMLYEKRSWIAEQILERAVDRSSYFLA